MIPSVGYVASHCMKKPPRLVSNIALCLVLMAASTALLSLVRPSPALLARMLGRPLMDQAMQELADQGLAGSVEKPLVFATSGDGVCDPEIARIAAMRSDLVAAGNSPGVLTDVTFRCWREDGHFMLSTVSGEEAVTGSKPEPDFRAVLPPIFAVILAMGLRNVHIALLLAIWTGGLLAFGVDWTLGTKPLVVRYLLGTLVDQFNFSILVFTLALVGMVQVANRAGGGQGLANAVGRLARSARSSRIAACLLGLLIFFDDYSNTVVVGTTIRSLTDKYRVSREKLAYIVDSTSAPVAGIALISTWIGYEVGLFQELSTSLGLGMTGYALFLKALPLRFYCFGTILFVLLTSAMNRDFGPMLKAERRAMETGQLTAPGSRPMGSKAMDKVKAIEGINPLWLTVVVPVVTSLLVVMSGMVLDGGKAGSMAAGWASEHSRISLTYVRLCFEGADASFVLLVSSLAGTWAALLMAITRPFIGGTVGAAPVTRWWELVLPLPLCGLTALVIDVIHVTFTVDLEDGSKASAPSLAYVEALLQRPDSRIVGVMFIFLGIVGTAVLASRLVAERGSRRWGMTFVDASLAWGQGLRSMSYAISILVMAWAIRRVCDDLGTSTFIVSTLGSVARPWLIPALTFVLASIVAFSTGTSWGTMGILIPTLMPFAFHMGGMPTLVISLGAVLDGAIFGDHCSPISDTTVLSSMASGCDHIDHVKTQLPYAVTVFLAALVAGYLPLGLGVPVAVEHIALAVLLLVAVRFLGRRITS